MEDAVSPVAQPCPQSLIPWLRAQGILFPEAPHCPEGTRPPQAPSTPALGDVTWAPPEGAQLPLHRSAGDTAPWAPMAAGGAAAAAPQPALDCRLPGQARPHSTCPRCATAARWWTPRRRPCDGWGGPGCSAAGPARGRAAPRRPPQGEQRPQLGPSRCQRQPGHSAPAPARATHPTRCVTVRVTLPLH